MGRGFQRGGYLLGKVGPGRPLKAGVARKQWAARLPLSTIDQIDELSASLDISKSDVVAKAVDLLSSP